jgi:2-hydroxychromene-2-carboxylate isomerase
VLLPILAGLDLDGGQLVERAQSAATKAKLRSQTEEAGRLGIFGAPTMRVGEELFWGNDRVEAALTWVGK